MSNNDLIWPAKGALAVPGHQATSSITIWTDYAVWGLDIYDNQPTWFSLIELVIVLTDRWRKGARLAYLPEDTVREHIATGQLIQVLADWSPPASGYHLYYPSRRQPTPAFALIVDAVRYRS